MWKNYDGKYLKFCQSKTGVDISIPVYKLLPLKKYLNSLKKRGFYIVCYYDKNKKSFKNYTKDLFVHHFSETKKLSKIKNKLFRDFRRTGITKLAEAGCTSLEISSISGHSHKTIQKMLDIYASKKGNISDSAAKKLMNVVRLKNEKS